MVRTDPDGTDLELPGLPAGRQGRSGRDGHAQGDAHDLQYPRRAYAALLAVARSTLWGRSGTTGG